MNFKHITAKVLLLITLNVTTFFLRNNCFLFWGEPTPPLDTIERTLEK